jgi:CheY-like chemotaxis protein
VEPPRARDECVSNRVSRSDSQHPAGFSYCVTWSTAVTKAAVANSVLVIEDDADTREALRSVLSSEGFAVHLAKDGSDALRVLRAAAEAPSVILVDLKMPNVDGSDFLDEWRRDPRWAQSRIFMLTAAPHDPRLGRHRDVSVLPKPIQLAKLLSILEA